MPIFPLTHVKLVPVERSEETLELECASGDFVRASEVGGSVLLTVDDVDRTLPDPAGEPTVPTVMLGRSESHRLGRWLLGAIWE